MKKLIHSPQNQFKCFGDDDVENEKLIKPNQLDKKDNEFLKLTSTQKKELDRRLQDHENGVGTTYIWEETIALTDKALEDLKKV